MQLLWALSEVAIVSACVLGLVHLGSRIRRRVRQRQPPPSLSDKSH
jgi:hypothetical protein